MQQPPAKARGCLGGHTFPWSSGMVPGNQRPVGPEPFVVFFACQLDLEPAAGDFSEMRCEPIPRDFEVGFWEPCVLPIGFLLSGLSDNDSQLVVSWK